MRVGIDLQPVGEVLDSLVAYGDRYRRRLFTEREVDDCGGWGAAPSTSAAALAARFAAKEATLKALHVGDRVPAWTDIEVIREASGWPCLHLHGCAAELAAEASLTQFELSLSHTDTVASAIVVAC